MADLKHKKEGRITSNREDISSSSQCPQCHQKYTEAASSSSDSQSVSDHVIIPLRKHMMEAADGNAQVQSQLSHLQRQIQILKRQNMQKDLIIQQLRKTLTRHKFQNQQHENYFDDEKEQMQSKIKQNRKDIKFLKDKVRDLQKLKDFDIQNQDRNMKKIKSLSNLSGNLNKKERERQGKMNQVTLNEGIQAQYYGNYNRNKLKRVQRSAKKAPIYLQNRAEYLQHQDQKQRLLYLYENNKWMTNFIYAFIQMAQGFSQQYKQQIFMKNWDLKKRAKVSWRYIKHLIRFWLKQD